MKSYISKLHFVFYDLIGIPTMMSSRASFLEAVKLSQSKMRYPNLRCLPVHKKEQETIGCSHYQQYQVQNICCLPIPFSHKIARFICCLLSFPYTCIKITT